MKNLIAVSGILLLSLMMSLNAQQITTPLVPDQMTFAGEEIPLQSFDVRERLEAELIVNTYQQSAMLLKLKRAHRWFAVIEPILKENGIPDDFKYLAVAESALEENAESATGAAGFWQFMDSTAVQYGLEVRRDQGKMMVDERYHVEKATVAACKLLKAMHSKHGSWLHAIVAYNWGSRNLTEALKSQNASSFFDLNSGSEEVMRYLFRVLAHKQIMENAKVYGFDLDKSDLYETLPKAQSVTVKEAIPALGSWAAEQGTTYRMLKLYNPWLRNNSLSVPVGKTYNLKIVTKPE